MWKVSWFYEKQKNCFQTGNHPYAMAHQLLLLVLYLVLYSCTNQTSTTRVATTNTVSSTVYASHVQSETTFLIRSPV